MVTEGLLFEIPQKNLRNQKFYAKALFSNVTRFSNYNGENVSLKEFIHTLIEDVNPEFIDSSAMTAIKAWMLDCLGSSIPVAYEDSGRESPNTLELKKRLQVVLEQTRQFHAFVKMFVDADIWTDAAKDRLSSEFKSMCVEEHAIIVDRNWMEK
ncbi:hypothetical protein ACFY7C_36760 [Streptomyces sp. NPDC012769]|uniref:hypothetical protein n=1 Tax=Streptomyces sp. NPDC012769 TaxID=3364848 RepID=UPI0036B91CDB